jgi:hypothetical protein
LLLYRRCLVRRAVRALAAAAREPALWLAEAARRSSRVAPTGGVGAEAALALPSAFVATTTIRRRRPTSAEAGT